MSVKLPLAPTATSFAPRDWRVEPQPRAPRAFANPDVFLPAWFALARSRRVRGSRPLEVSVGPTRVVLWRDGAGVARAFAPACPHLGANLGFGRVVGGELRCALHHWRFDGAGACAASPGTSPTSGRRAHTFPVIEKYGLTFVYPAADPAPPFPAMPDGDDERAFRAIVLPPARLRCHHHLATANGLDALHFDSLHDVEPLGEARYEIDEANAAVHLTLHGRYRGRLLRALTGGELHGRFSAIGPSVAWVTFLGRLRWHALFVTRPLADGGSESRAVLLVPRGRALGVLRSIGFLLSLGRQDGQMLNAFATFHPGFVDSDAPLAAYARLLDRWPGARAP
jgi:nitrite reductase/ring-hydroxylating ferredoxin subunit